MAKIEMYGEHEIRIKFNNSHACKFWIEEIRKEMSLALRKTKLPNSKTVVGKI